MAVDYTFFLHENHRFGTELFVRHRILSENKKAQCVSDRVTYIVMSGRWCNIIVLNVYERNEKKSDYSKGISIGN